MPRLPLKPYWQTSDHNTVKLYQGDVLKVLSRMPTGSVQMVMTSPPYWGLRDYGTDKTVEIGSESTPGEYVAKMVEVFNEVRRVLRNDGTVWLNMGDSLGVTIRSTAVAFTDQESPWMGGNLVWYVLENSLRQ